MPIPWEAYDGTIPDTSILSLIKDSLEANNDGPLFIPDKFKKLYYNREDKKQRDAYFYHLHFHLGVQIPAIADASGYNGGTINGMVYNYRNQYQNDEDDGYAEKIATAIEQDRAKERSLALVSPKVFDDDKYDYFEIDGFKELCNISRAERVIEFNHDQLLIPNGLGVNIPFKLFEWQRDRFFGIFAPIRGDNDNRRLKYRFLLSCAKQNGKSELAAAILAAYIVGPERIPYTTIVSAATDREQAGIVFSKVSHMIRENPELDAVVKIAERGFHMRTKDGSDITYKAIPRQSESAQGKPNPLFVFDELAQQKDLRLYQALNKQQGKYEEALGVIISTMSDIPTNPMNIMVDYARKAKAGGAAANRRWHSAIYEAEPGINIEDWEATKVGLEAANPNIGVSPTWDDVEEDYNAAKHLSLIHI